jgi:3-phosphoshikimate 1-carboxyvinyltransferase
VNLRVRPCQALRGAVTVPADKSISHRALLLGGIAEGVSTVRNWLPAADCQATLSAMRAMGVSVEQSSPTELHIHGVGLRGLKPPATPIDCQRSGTTIRLLAGILAGQAFSITLDGDTGLRRRPMERVAIPLREMGAVVETRNGCPPLVVKGRNLHGIDYRLPVASAQVKSAILLAALYAEGPSTVRQPGPARDHTERMLMAQGADIELREDTITLTPGSQPLKPFSLTVPADFSSAAFPLVAALLVPNSDLVLEGIGINPTRTGLIDVLGDMGAELRRQNQAEQAGEPTADLVIRSAATPHAPRAPSLGDGTAMDNALRGTQVGGQTVVRMIDEFPVLAVAATQAHGQTLVRDARELRLKETDRIGAVVAELRKLGASVAERDDGFSVDGPTRLRGARVHSHGDHRLAMALAVAGLIAEGETVVEGAEVMADSFPEFVGLMRKLGAELDEE